MPEIQRFPVSPVAAAEAIAKIMPSRVGKTVYFAHAQLMYGTGEEKAQLELIARRFSDHAIANPAIISEYKIRDMHFYFLIVERCDALVFTRFHGHVLGGVGLEVEHAFKTGKAVYELSGTDFTRVEAVPEYLSYEQTIALFRSLGLRR